MGRVLAIIYGALILAVVITTWIGLFPRLFLPFVVIVLGALIFMTPIVRGPAFGSPAYAGAPSAPFQFIRRRIFGAYMVLAGLMSFVDVYSNFPWLARTSIYTFSGQAILLGIGAIYFLSAFGKTRAINISSI